MIDFYCSHVVTDKDLTDLQGRKKLQESDESYIGKRGAEALKNRDKAFVDTCADIVKDMTKYSKDGEALAVIKNNCINYHSCCRKK